MAVITMVISHFTNPMFPQLFFTCKNTTLGVEEAASPVVAFKCK